MDYLLFYDLAPDYIERRGRYREEHLKLAWDAHTKGHLVIAGALADPPDCAVMHFRCDAPMVVQEFVTADPYVKNGLVVHFRIREWTTVVGDAALTPVRPKKI